MTMSAKKIKAMKVERHILDEFEARIAVGPFTLADINGSVGELMLATGQWTKADIGAYVEMLLQTARRELKIKYHAKKKEWWPAVDAPPLAVPAFVGTVMEVDALDDQHGKRQTDVSHFLKVEFASGADRDKWLYFFQDAMALGRERAKKPVRRETPGIEIMKGLRGVSLASFVKLEAAE